MPKHKWDSATEWLYHHVKDMNKAELLGVINSLVPQMCNDDIQDIFQAEMEADGYFVDHEPEVTAEVHSDDHVYERKFVANPWLEQASDSEILDLLECGCRGDYAADEVAQFCDDQKPVAEVFKYIEARKDQGFEVSVNEEELRAWLAKHRPSVLEHEDDDEEEEQRRDEKNGLYGGLVDPAN